KRRHAFAPAEDVELRAPALDNLFYDAAKLLGNSPSFATQAAVEAAMDYLAECDDFMSRLEAHARSRLGRARRQDTNADDTAFDDLMVDLMIAVQDRVTDWVRLDLPSRDLMNHTHYFGAVSGANVGKLELAKLATFKASKIGAPLIENCLAYVECSLEDALRVGDHTLFVGRILVVQAEPEAFDGTWLIDDPDYRPLPYLRIDRYAVLDKRLTAELRT